MQPSTIKELLISEKFKCKNIYDLALTGMAQWSGHHSTNQKVAGLIPGQGTCLGCRPGLWLGACERQLIDVSLTH